MINRIFFPLHLIFFSFPWLFWKDGQSRRLQRAVGWQKLSWLSKPSKKRLQLPWRSMCRVWCLRRPAQGPVVTFHSEKDCCFFCWAHSGQQQKCSNNLFSKSIDYLNCIVRYLFQGVGGTVQLPHGFLKKAAAGSTTVRIAAWRKEVFWAPIPRSPKWTRKRIFTPDYRASKGRRSGAGPNPEVRVSLDFMAPIWACRPTWP